MGFCRINLFKIRELLTILDRKSCKRMAKLGLKGQSHRFGDLAQSNQENSRETLILWSYCNFLVIVHSRQIGSFMEKLARLYEDF